MQVSEVFSLFGFKVAPGTETKLRDFAKVLGDINMSSVLAATGLGAAGVALGDFADKTAKSAQSLQNLHTYTGIDTKTLQQWEEYAQVLGFTKETVDSLFISLQKQVGALKLNQQGLGILAQLDIKPNDNPTKMFGNAIRKLSQMKDIGQRNYLAQMIGLTQDQLTFGLKMAADPDSMKKLQARPFMTDEQLATWEKLAQTWTTLIQDTEQLLASMTIIAKYLNFSAQVLDVPNHLKNIKNFFDKGFPDLRLHGAAVSGSQHQVNHITIHAHGTGTDILKQIEEAIARAVKTAFYKDPSQQR